MSNRAAHTIHGAHHHFGWDHAIPPALTIAPGATVEFEVVDAGGGQLLPTSTVADVGRIDFARTPVPLKSAAMESIIATAADFDAAYSAEEAA